MFRPTDSLYCILGADMNSMFLCDGCELLEKFLQHECGIHNIFGLHRFDLIHHRPVAGICGGTVHIFIAMGNVLQAVVRFMRVPLARVPAK